jgi:hypothetical protein
MSISFNDLRIASELPKDTAFSIPVLYVPSRSTGGTHSIPD